MNRVQTALAKAFRIPTDSPVRQLEALSIRTGQGLSDAGINTWLANLGLQMPGDNARFYETSVPVYRGVKLRADAIARARLKIFRQMRNGRQEWVGENDPVQSLLDRVNVGWTRTQMWRTVETWLLVHGSSFRWINKNDSSNPDRWEIRLLNPNRTVPVFTARQMDPGGKGLLPFQDLRGFIYDPHLRPFAMLPDEVIWDHYIDPNDETGSMSPLKPAGLSVTMHRDMMEVNDKLFKQGVIASNLAFMVNGPLNDTELQRFFDLIEERYQGKDKAMRPIVFERGQGDVKNLQFSNADMQCIELLNMTKQQVADALGVPEELMAGAAHPTFSNREAAIRDFYQNTIRQELDFLESNIQEQFIPMLPPSRRNEIARFDIADIPQLQPLPGEMALREEGDVRSGIRLINEVRDERGMDPVPHGNSWWIPFSLAPAGEGGPAGFGGRSRDLSGTHNGRSRVLGVDRERQIWGSFVARVESRRPDFEKIQRELFDEQAASVRRNIVHLFSRADIGSIFNQQEWNNVYIRAGLPMLTLALEESAVAQATEFSLNVVFDVTQALPQTWLDQRALFWADRTNEFTATILQETLLEGIAENEGIAKLQRRVGDVFGDFSDFRTERIARTEVTAAANQGHLEVYRQSEVEEKEWLSTLDDRIREAHAEAHGQRVSVEQAFLVGGEELMAPGQDGSPANVINCRCTMFPIIN